MSEEEKNENLNAQEKPAISEQPMTPAVRRQNQIEVLLERLRESAKEKGYNVEESPLKVLIGSKKVYEQNPGQPPKQLEVKPEQIDLLQKALDDPQSVKGTVKISIGNQEVYRVKDGRVLADHLGLSAQLHSQNQAQAKRVQHADPDSIFEREAQQQNQAQAEPVQNVEPDSIFEQEVQQQNQAQAEPVQNVEPDSIFEREAQQQNQSQAKEPAAQQEAPATSAASAAGANKQSTGETKAAQTPAATTQPDQKALQKQIASLQQQIARLEGQVQKLSGQFEKAQQPSPKQQSRVLEWLSQTQDKVVEGLNAVVERLTAQSRELATTALVGGIKTVVNTVGEKQPDGTKVLESDKISQTHRLGVSANQELYLSKRPDENTPERMWEKYNQGASAGHGYINAETAVRRALSDGQTVGAARQMMTQDPQYQNFLKEKGQSTADKYADLVVQSAVHKEKQRVQPKVQQHQQVEENLGRGRAR